MDLNLNEPEFAKPQRYDGKTELKFAIFACFAWFFAVLVRLNIEDYGDKWTSNEQTIEALSFVAFGGLPVFFLATPQGSRFARETLLRRNGIYFQAIICITLVTYIVLVKSLGLSSDRFLWLGQMNNLIIEGNFTLNLILFIIGVFVAMRIPFLLLSIRREKQDIKESKNILLIVKSNSELFLLLVVNFLYLSLSHTSLVSTNFSSSNFEGYYVGFSYLFVFFLANLFTPKQTSLNRLTIFDFLLIATCVSTLFWFSTPFFSFGIFISTVLFIVVVIYGTRLGREHFGYSFQVRWKDALYLGKQTLLSLLVLVPLALVSGFVNPSRVQLQPGILKLSSYFILFSFRVGVFEEIFFRSGLMVFIRDQLQAWLQNSIDPQKCTFWAAVICSIIFGFTHIGNNPGAGSLLTSVQYKSAYIGLATLASFFYSLTFGQTNRLWGPIMLHGFIDTVTVVLLGGFLTVPF